MKTEISLILGKINKKEQLFSDSYFSLFLDNNNQIPSQHVDQNGIDSAMDKIFADYLKLNKRWPDIRLSDARVYLKNKVLTTQIVYTCLVPSIWQIEKTGRFYTKKEMRDTDIEIDPFIAGVISKQAISLYR